jgi:hypothetical protein
MTGLLLLLWAVTALRLGLRSARDLKLGCAAPPLRPMLRRMPGDRGATRCRNITLEDQKHWGIKATGRISTTQLPNGGPFWDGVPPTWQPRFGGALLFLEAYSLPKITIGKGKVGAK